MAAHGKNKGTDGTNADEVLSDSIDVDSIIEVPDGGAASVFSTKRAAGAASRATAKAHTPPGLPMTRGAAAMQPKKVLFANSDSDLQAMMQRAVNKLKSADKVPADAPCSVGTASRAVTGAGTEVEEVDGTAAGVSSSSSGASRALSRHRTRADDTRSCRCGLRRTIHGPLSSEEERSEDSTEDSGVGTDGPDSDGIWTPCCGMAIPLHHGNPFCLLFSRFFASVRMDA